MSSNAEKFTVKGFTGNKAQIARRFGIKVGTFYARLSRGFTLEEAVGLQKRKSINREQLTIGDFTGTKSEIARHFDIDYRAFYQRLRSGYTLEEAVKGKRDEKTN